MLEISLFDVLIKVFWEFIILLAPTWFSFLDLLKKKEKKSKKNHFCSLLFVHAVQWQSPLNIIYSISNHACSICGLLEEDIL